MPGKAVIVISFDEPDDSMILGGYIEAAQQGFPALKKPGTKISMGIKDVADRVIAIFEPLEEEKEDGG